MKYNPSEAVCRASSIVTEIGMILDNGLCAVRDDSLDDDLTPVEKIDEINARVNEMYTESRLRLKLVIDALVEVMPPVTQPVDQAS